MIITTQINMDLIRAEKTPTVRLVCDDKLSRTVQLNLFADGEAVELPKNGKVLVRYGKPDGTGGSYDTLPDFDIVYNSCGHIPVFQWNQANPTGSDRFII